MSIAIILISVVVGGGLVICGIFIGMKMTKKETPIMFYGEDDKVEVKPIKKVEKEEEMVYFAPDDHKQAIEEEMRNG